MAKDFRKEKSADESSATTETRRENKSSRPNKEGAKASSLLFVSDPNVSESVAKLAFNSFSGLTKINNKVVPTVMSITLNASLGVTPYSDASDPVDAEMFKHVGINQAANQLWALWTSLIGYNTSFTSNDISILLGAQGAALETVEFIRRAFGIFEYYSALNRAVPSVLFRAMCIDEDDFNKHHQDYLVRADKLIQSMKGLFIPDNIKWFARCIQMYRGIYKDHESDMAQLYLFVPHTTWVIDEESYQLGTVLRTVPMTAGYLGGVAHTAADQLSNESGGYSSATEIKPMSYYLDVLALQINRLLGSTTCSQISAVLNTLATKTGKVTFMTPEVISGSPAVTPEYNEGVLNLIHNSIGIGPAQYNQREDFESEAIAQKDHTKWNERYGMATPLNDVYSDVDGNVLVYNPGFNASRANSSSTDRQYFQDVLFDITDKSIIGNTNGVLTYTRFLPGMDHELKFWSKNTCISDLALPDHYVVGYQVFRTASENDAALGLCSWPFLFGNPGSGDYGEVAAALANFDWAPQICLTSDEDVINHVVYPTSPVCDLDIYTKLTKSWIRNVADSIYIALFSVLR